MKLLSPGQTHLCSCLLQKAEELRSGERSYGTHIRAGRFVDQNACATIAIRTVLAAALLLPPAAHAADLMLAADGKSDYQIVRPDKPTPVDNYAIKELAHYLQEITGAEFPVVAPETTAAERPAIFLGVSAPALKHLRGDPLAELKADDHVARSIGEHVFLHGKGVHGNLYAVFEFLESSLGWRWFSVFEHPVVPSRPSVILKPFHRKKGFAFAFRKVNLHRSMDFPCIHGTNQGISARARDILRRSAEADRARFAHFVSRKPEFGRGHSLHLYIPPKDKGQGRHSYEWLEKDNYFKTNPELFSQWENGQRVPNKQLCFSNPGLCRELTKNVLKHIEVAGEDVILTVGANDHPGKFCYCPECAQLEEQYQSPGGPIYDYLIELCDLLARKHPKVMIKTFAYRRSQTQEPPILPKGEKLPDNLIVDFAPIEDCYFADWLNHRGPKIQDTYNDLLAWGKIAENLWAWLYPNPWGSGINMPVGNVERVVNNMRLMADAGVSGVFTDHCSFHQRGGWAELQQYLFFKLMKDPNCDTDAVVEEFTDYMYGSAGARMRTYLHELEEGRKAMEDLPPNVTYRSYNTDDRTFPYLTVENIHRWQRYFEEMEKLVADQLERVLINVRLVRRELDLAVLWKWFALRKAYPNDYRDYKVFSSRIAAVNKARPQPWMNDGVRNRTAWEHGNDRGINRKAKPLGVSVLRDLVTLIQAGGEEKPLPAQFEGIDRSRIRTFVPQYPNNRPGRAIIKDPDAAFGYAVPVELPDLPFNFGFYQIDTKTHGARRALKVEEIKPDVYTTYKLGEVEVSPKCILWFSARSWATKVSLGERLYEPGADNHWEAYVSVKFEGPTFGAQVNEGLVPIKERRHYKGDEAGDLALVDRIILIRKKANC